MMASPALEAMQKEQRAVNRVALRVHAEAKCLVVGTNELAEVAEGPTDAA